MKREKEEKFNVLLSLPAKLNEKLLTQSRIENRSRQAQIVFILEKYFSEQIKEKKS